MRLLTMRQTSKGKKSGLGDNPIGDLIGKVFKR